MPSIASTPFGLLGQAASHHCSERIGPRGSAVPAGGISGEWRNSTASFDALRLLDYAFAAAHLGSMRRVARCFGVQQSSISRNIVALEQRLDIQIFDRNTSGVCLTREGRAWLANVRTHYEALQDALIDPQRNTGNETIRIGLGFPTGREFLIHLIERFRRTHPDLGIIIQDIAWGTHAEAIRRRHLDIAFVDGCCESSSCRSERIWEERLAVLLAAEHPLAEKDALSWTDLAGEVLLVPLAADGPQFDPCFLKPIVAGSTAPLIRQCQATQATVMVEVQLGNGFTLAGESFARAVQIDGVIWRPITGKRATSPINAVWLESNPKRAILRLLTVARNIALSKRPEFS